MNYVHEFVSKFGMTTEPGDSENYRIIEEHINIFMLEEFEELLAAWSTGNVEEIVDAIGDISWHCDKFYELAHVDGDKVRKEIGRANLSKEVGIKPGRESAKIDVVKPKGWKGPSHKGNHGILAELFNED